MTKSPFIIGVTGGIGSGKSTVASHFEALGIVSVDADQASRAVVAPGMPALIDIAEHFGNTILTADGELNRAKLRELIFSCTDEKIWLERLLHPLIRTWILDQLSQAQGPYVILESPLLFETDQHLLVDHVLLIDIPIELQRQRAAARDGTTAQQIQSIINNQMPREEKRHRAQWIFDNTLDQDTIAPRIKALHQVILDHAKKV
ncbi:MAG: dephospho-CoA kinase [Porticoccaceae bacterium]|nr:dephospho-CoA kinase [Porticoccaceae bacterium]MDG1474889.1 dephospho-CoA kinase [Porticoccaceae bacterium]